MKAVKRKLCAIMCVALLVGIMIPTASAATFTDVTDHWASSYIETCADLGIVDGVGGGKFEPNGTVTNAQFVKMLCMAFFADEEKAFEAEHWNDIYNNFAGVLYWYSAMGYYFKVSGLLTGTTYTIITSDHANKPMDRNNMAQVAANVLARKGIGVNDADLNAAQAQMPDYSTIPEGYRTAVKTCYALGVITGTDGGRFDGSATMTRAQACAVIVRLENLIADGGNDADPAPVVTSDPIVTPEVPTVTDINVTSHTNPVQAFTSWNVPDNGFASGYLNNGKPITEENVLELLAEAEKVWPNGIIWDDRNVANNNTYANPSNTITSAMSANMTGTIIGVNTNYACGGFAAMISDYLFGHKGNPVHRVTDMTKIRPGDVILHVDKDANRILHASISISSAITRVSPDGKEYPGCVWTADGNSSGKVSWPDELAYKYGAPSNQDQSFVGHNIYWIVWSRYPN